MKTKILIVLVLMISFYGSAQQIEIIKNDNSIEKVDYQNRTFGNKDIELDDKELLSYDDITKINTDFFEAYERAMKKLSKEKYKHIEVVFTGDQNVYSLQLEKLKSKRLGIETTRAAGGLLTLIGVISGDRQLTSLGVLTSYVGDVSQAENNQKSIDVQTEMLNELDKKSKTAEKGKSEISILMESYGKENVEAVIALIENKPQKAVALANVGETSEDANYRLSAIWVKALIAKDQGQKEIMEKEYDRLITFDPTIKSESDVEKELEFLVKELKTLRG